MIRALLVITLAALALTGSPAAAERELRFAVALDGTRVGHHTFRLVKEGGQRRVESEARIAVKFLVFDAYRYIHSTDERWRGDCLEAIRSRTDDNGERIAVQGARRDGRFVLETGHERRELPPCVMTFAYWNSAILDQPRLLSAHTGEFLPVEVLPLGEETITVHGEPTAARRYALRTPEHRIDVWYAGDERWVQLELLTPEGKRLRYTIQ